MGRLVFVAPLMLPEYPAALLSFGRYLVVRRHRAAAGLVLRQNAGAGGHLLPGELVDVRDRQCRA
jgi:hypothetical protein